MNAPRRAVVTGANRGIGHAVAAHLLERGDLVALAVRRADAPAVRALVDRHGARAIPLELDIEDGGSVAAAATRLAGAVAAVDVVVHCAGVNVAPGHARSATKGTLAELDADAVDEMFRINVTGALRFVQAIRSLLDASPAPRVMALGTSRGSMTLTDDGRSTGYAVTKAALSMLVRKIAFESRERGWRVVTVDPGWVHTDMGGEDAPLPPEEAAEDLVALLDGLGDDDSGRFLDRTGKDVPW